MSHFELGLSYPRRKRCEAHAISFFKSYQACEYLKAKYEKFENMYIIKGCILEEHGVNDSLISDEDVNLWTYEQINLLKHFERTGIRW